MLISFLRKRCVQQTACFRKPAGVSTQQQKRAAVEAPQLFEAFVPFSTLSTPSSRSTVQQVERFLQQHYSPPVRVQRNGLVLAGTDAAFKWRIAVAVAGELNYTFIDARRGNATCALQQARTCLPCVLFLDTNQLADGPLCAAARKEKRLLLLVDAITNAHTLDVHCNTFVDTILCQRDEPYVFEVVHGVLRRRACTPSSFSCGGF